MHQCAPPRCRVDQEDDYDRRQLHSFRVIDFSFGLPAQRLQYRTTMFRGPVVRLARRVRDGDRHNAALFSRRMSCGAIVVDTIIMCPSYHSVDGHHSDWWESGNGRLVFLM
jgi:hypothetical protein